jgi:hypothetical protein
LHWSGNAEGGGEDGGASSPKVEAKSRTLAMLAIQHNALRVLAALLAKGADPQLRTTDGGGQNCYEVRARACALASQSAGARLVVAQRAAAAAVVTPRRSVFAA